MTEAIDWGESFDAPRGPEEMKQAGRQLGYTIDQLTAISSSLDPFYTGGPTDERDTSWFKSVWDRFVTAATYVRRLHYKVLSVRMAASDGEPYENTEGHANGLYKAASKARDLGLIDPFALDDHRNPPPIINRYPRPYQEEPGWDWTEPEPWDVPVDDVYELARLEPFRVGRVTTDGYGYDDDDQPVLVEVWIEKTTMDDVLIPLCASLDVNLVRFGGFGSEIAMAKLLQRVNRHGKPARILYISDFDPAGDAMHVAIARNIEFYRPTLAPGSDIALQRIMLTREQIDRYELPRVPIKETDVRKAKFEAVNGAGAVELDALEALYPGEMRTIVRAAIEPYIDPSLRRRLADAGTDAYDIARDTFTDTTTEIRGELHRLHGAIVDAGVVAEQRRRPITSEYWQRRKPIDDEYKRRIAELDEWRREQEQPIVDETRGLVVAHVDELNGLRRQLTEAVEEMAVDLPERPEGEYVGADDEADWMYRSDRPWLEQLARYHRERGRDFTSRKRACDGCGEPFTPARNDARICSRACRRTRDRRAA